MTLTIDGQSHPIQEIAFLYQKMPFPGQHVFRIEFRSEFLATEFRKVGGEDLKRFVESHGKSILVDVGGFVSLYKMHAPEMTIEYFANSVTALEIRDDIIICEGVCSKVMR